MQHYPTTFQGCETELFDLVDAETGVLVNIANEHVEPFSTWRAAALAQTSYQRLTHRAARIDLHRAPRTEITSIAVARARREARRAATLLRRSPIDAA